ncbi:Kinesin light chain [Trichoplax sp. H2]|nr:Kinesin light chain [Trichoplax sp. H2]|eukprot:RDD40573.1 Kinesin light chain [Trichoplax sp. H2]
MKLEDDQVDKVDRKTSLSSDGSNGILASIEDKIDQDDLNQLKPVINDIRSITSSTVDRNVRTIIDILSGNKQDDRKFDYKQYFKTATICRQILVEILSYYNLTCQQIELLLPSIRLLTDKFREIINFEEKDQQAESCYDDQLGKDNSKYQQRSSVDLLSIYATFMELLIIEDLIRQSTSLHPVHVAYCYAQWYHRCHQILRNNNRKILFELMMDLKDHLIDYQYCYIAIDCLSQIIQSSYCSYDLKLIAIYGTEYQPSIAKVSILGYKNLLDYCLHRLPYNTRQLKIVVYKWLMDMLTIIQLPSLSDTLRKPLYDELKQRLVCIPAEIRHQCLQDSLITDSQLQLILQESETPHSPQREQQGRQKQHENHREQHQEQLRQQQEQQQRQQQQYYRCFIDNIELPNSIIGQPFQLICLPSRFPNFMRNHDHLMGIESQLKKNKNCAIQGESGLGKTTLAIEYAHQHRHFYDIIYYFDASSILSLQRDFIRLGIELCRSSRVHSFRFTLYENLCQLLGHYNDIAINPHDYNYYDDKIISLMDRIYYDHGWIFHPWLKSFISLIIDILQSHHSALLIFDDIRYLQWIKTYLPGGENIHVILVFDQVHNDDTIRFIKVKPLSSEISRRYLQKVPLAKTTTSNDDTQASAAATTNATAIATTTNAATTTTATTTSSTTVNTNTNQNGQNGGRRISRQYLNRLNDSSPLTILTKLCHGCPLLLHFIRSYTQVSRITLGDYYQEVVNDIAPLTYSNQSNRHLMTVAVAIILVKPAVTSIFQQYPIAAELLTFISFVSPRHIDKIELLHYLNYNSHSRQDLNFAIQILYNYGMINESCHGYRIHSIIQNVVHMKLKDEKIYQQTIDSILTYFLHQFEELEKISTLYPYYNRHQFYYELVVHAEYCCRYANGNHHNLAEIAAKIKLHLAKCYLQSYCYTQADDYCQASLQYFMNHDGENDSKTCQCYDILARIDYATGQFQSALDYLQLSLKCKQELLEQSHHIQFIPYYRQLFQVYCRLHRYGDAKSTLQSLETAYRDNSKSNRLAQLYCHYDYISFYYFQGNYDQALTHCQHGVDYVSRINPQDERLIQQLKYHSGLIYLAMADIHWSQSQLTKASQYLNQSQTILKVITLDKHFCRSRIALLHGLIALSQGKYDDALNNGKQALSNAIINYGGKHIYVARLQDIMGDIYKRLPEQNELALKSYNAAILLKKGILNAENADITNTYIKLGGLLRMMGKFDKAITLLEKALNLQKTIFGDHHFQLSTTYDVIGRIHTATQDYVLARRYIATAIQIKQAAFGDNHFNLANSYNFLGETYSIDGNHIQSLDHFGTAVALAMQVDDSNVFELARYFNNHAVAIFNTRSNYEDENERIELVFYFLNQSLKLKLQSRGEYSREVEECYQNFANFYQRLAINEEQRVDESISNREIQDTQLRQALDYYKKILKIQLKVHSNDSLEIIETCRNIVIILIRFNEYDDALEHQKMILEVYMRRIGNENIQVAMCYYEMGESYNRLQDKKMANLCLQKALAVGNNCEDLREDFLGEIKAKIKEINLQNKSRLCTLI